MMKNIVFLILCSFSLQAQKTPNIIYILTDDLGYTDLSCYGNPFNETPNIDSLAIGGVKFMSCYASSPICSPSRAAIMTGIHPARLQLTNFLIGNRIDSNSTIAPAPWKPFLAASELTFPEVLKTYNYNTGMVGKWHLGSGLGQTPWEQGFDSAKMIGKNGLDYYNYSIFENSFQQEWTDDGKHYLTDKLTNYAKDFIKIQSSEKPFYLYLAYSAPHVFIIPRGDKLKKYFLKYLKFDGKYNPYYAAMLESVDDGVGEIMTLLKEKGLDENTIVIFTSDNGGLGMPELGPTPTNLEPLRAWKGHNYEGGIRIPMIASWPAGLPKNNVSDQYFANVDHAETLLDLIGRPKDLSSDGQSMKSLFLKPNEASERGPIFWHYPHFSNQMGRPSAAVRNGDWKLVEFYETDNTELYNLSKDIGEHEDLSDQFPEKSKELFALLKNWRIEVKANMPVPNPLKK
jgi:arylsulfatase A-like enzyme